MAVETDRIPRRESATKLLCIESRTLLRLSEPASASSQVEELATILCNQYCTAVVEGPEDSQIADWLSCDRVSEVGGCTIKEVAAGADVEWGVCTSCRVCSIANIRK